MWLDAYWHWAGSNIGAMPAEAAVGAAAGVIFRKPIGRFITWLRKEKDAELARTRADAEAARKIAADLYRHVTGEDHHLQQEEGARADG